MNKGKPWTNNKKCATFDEANLHREKLLKEFQNTKEVKVKRYVSEEGNEYFLVKTRSLKDEEGKDSSNKKKRNPKQKLSKKEKRASKKAF